MKKGVYAFAFAALGLFACNNAANDSVEKADSTNQEKMDTPSTGANTTEAPITTDEATTKFLVDAADGGMAEVNQSRVAQDKGTNQAVKDFAAMMLRDHNDANAKVKAFAARRNVTLPDSVSNENKKNFDDLNKKSGADFDKAYIKNMVNDHEKTIKLFEKNSDDVKDAEVKAFIDGTLPTLKAHLDSVKAIQKRLK